MSASAILAQFFAERQAATEAGDPMSALLSLATVSAAGLPEVRTLVLREVEGHPAIFINQTSPKWQALQTTRQLSFMTYWPSSGLQYRFDCHHSLIPKAVVDSSWLLRPESPKRLDHLYERLAPQSAAVRDRQALLAAAAALPATTLDTPTTAAIGLRLDPFVIERLNIGMDGAPHDRCRFQASQDWQRETLMP